MCERVRSLKKCPHRAIHMLDHQCRGPSRASTSQTQYLLAIGVVCREPAIDRRARLRKLYARIASSSDVVIRFVLDGAWWRSANATRFIDEVGAWSGGSTLDESHCALKVLSWWRTIAPCIHAKFYLKTDDDVVLDLPPLLSLIRAFPPGTPLYAGPMHYTYLNATGTRAPYCFAYGAKSAIRLGETACRKPLYEGPIIFAEGPLIILSRELLVKWLAPRMRSKDHYWPSDHPSLIRCNHEDSWLGAEIRNYDGPLHLVNLDTTLRGLHRPDMSVTHGFKGDKKRFRRLRPYSFVSHRVLDAKTFGLVEQAYENGDTAARPVELCTNATSRRRQQAKLRRFCDGEGQVRLPCRKWSEQFAKLERFGCCRDWRLCEPYPQKVDSRGERQVAKTLKVEGHR